MEDSPKENPKKTQLSPFMQEILEEHEYEDSYNLAMGLNIGDTEEK